MKPLSEMDADELKKLSEDVAEGLITALPQDTVWILILGDQRKFRGIVSQEDVGKVLEILKFTVNVIKQETIENN